MSDRERASERASVIRERLAALEAERRSLAHELTTLERRPRAMPGPAAPAAPVAGVVGEGGITAADGAGTRFARVEVVTHPAPRAITSAAPPAPVELTLVLRTPDGVEAVVTGLDAAAVAVRRGVLAPSVAGAT